MVMGCREYPRTRACLEVSGVCRIRIVTENFHAACGKDATVVIVYNVDAMTRASWNAMVFVL